MGRQFSDVDCKFGAPMGRAVSGYRLVAPARLFQVNLDRGGYDDGGAYWGLGPPLWCGTDEEGHRQFTRASNRSEAAFLLGLKVEDLKVKRGCYPMVEVTFQNGGSSPKTRLMPKNELEAMQALAWIKILKTVFKEP